MPARRKALCLKGHLRFGNTDTKGSCNTCKTLVSNNKRKTHGDEVRRYNRSLYKKRRKELRALYVLKQYGLTQKQYDNMLSRQKGKCCICNQTLDSSRKNLTPHIDHVHDKTKRVRGLLCGPCNVLLGVARDCINTLQNAIGYLKKWETQSGN